MNAFLKRASANVLRCPITLVLCKCINVSKMHPDDSYLHHILTSIALCTPISKTPSLSSHCWVPITNMQSHLVHNYPDLITADVSTTAEQWKQCAIVLLSFSVIHQHSYMEYTHLSRENKISLTGQDVATKEQAIATGFMGSGLLGEHKCVYTQTTCKHTHTNSCLTAGHSVPWMGGRGGQGFPDINREQRSKMTERHCPVSVRLELHAPLPPLLHIFPGFL